MVRAQRNSSAEVAPVRTPPPGRSGEAMLRMQGLGWERDLGRRVWAAVRVSVRMMRILGGGMEEGGVVSGCLECLGLLEAL